MAAPTPALVVIVRLAARALVAACVVLLLAWAWSTPPALLARGPYVQSLSATEATLVCRTDTETAVTLRCAEHAGPPWELESASPPGTLHVFALSGLRPETRYAYELDAPDRSLAGGTTGSFRTAPPAQSRAPFRFLAWGDSGTGEGPQFELAELINRGENPPDFAHLLGDLVYEDGAWEDYDWKLFGPYARLFRRAPFWTALGNHDVHTEEGAPYFDAFYLPTTGGAPEHPSGTENYYSFDYGMAHFACVDSQLSSSAPGGEMFTWLQDDLEAARAQGKRWTIVTMHKPVYSRGTHDSTEEADLIELHDNLVPLFDAEGVDLVLSGHSHDYERSYLLRNDAILQADPADYSKTGSSDGTVYVVTGCAGQRGSGPLDHPFMARSYGQVIGFSVFDVGFDELRGRFLEVDGRTTDLFTIHKGEDALPPRATALEVRTKYELGLHFDEPVQRGSGPQGAEDASHYVLSPAGAVLSADLDSDGSTVVLHTSSLPPNRVYGLAVDGVADTSGHAASQRVPCVRSDDPSRVPRALVPRGHVWRYLEGIDDPPADWNAPSFDDASWGSGPAGFGYGYPDVATELDDMRGAALVLYLRTDFVVDDPREVSGLVLDVDYDDGFVAFLNGAEIARANVDPRQTSMTPAFRSHDAGSFEPFDASDLRALLVPGRNVLAVEGHNVTIDGRDFLLHPELVVTTDAPGGPPVAVLRTQVRTANAPARIRFSSAGSSDEDGPLASLRWDFGDGTPGVSGAEVEHLYERAGTFLATLVVQDGDGQEALAQQSIRIHEQGQAPLALLAVERTSIAPGEGVAFDGEASHDPDGGALTFHWDFGDPASGTDNVSSSATPAHAYARSGTFLATLVATDDEGSSATSEVAIEVHAPASTGGGGGCSVAPQRARGDPLLLAIPTLLVLVWMRRRLQAARGPTARAARGG